MENKERNIPAFVQSHSIDDPIRLLKTLCLLLMSSYYYSYFAESWSNWLYAMPRIVWGESIGDSGYHSEWTSDVDTVYMSWRPHRCDYISGPFY